jgi:rRNA maturation endonuclease Nob1
MECASCRAEVPKEKRFCMECGGASTLGVLFLRQPQSTERQVLW